MSGQKEKLAAGTRVKLIFFLKPSLDSFSIDFNMSNDDQSKNDTGFVFNRKSDKKVNPKAQKHRCNDHLEDVLTGLSTWPLDVTKPFSIFLDCLKSQPGNDHN